MVLSFCTRTLMAEAGDRLPLSREMLVTEVVLCRNCTIMEDSWTCSLGVMIAE